MNLMMK